MTLKFLLTSEKKERDRERDRETVTERERKRGGEIRKKGGREIIAAHSIIRIFTDSAR